jgi:hypothetical protein
MTKLTEFYRQRAKKHWATQGDRNTSYFHHAILKRKRRNRIVSITDVNGNNLHDPDDIATEFVNYFRNIFRSSSANNDRPVLITTHPQESQDFTYSIPSKHEIWEILKSMKKNASPGPDGFNVAFYLAAWSWIGDDITALIRNFYITGMLLPLILLLFQKTNLAFYLLIIDRSAYVMLFINSLLNLWRTA